MGPVLPWPASFTLAPAAEDDWSQLPGYVFADSAAEPDAWTQIDLRVSPRPGEPWCGSFRARPELGLLDETIVGCPDGLSFLVVQAGIPLQVTARAPERVQVLEHCLPSVHLLVVRERGLFVLGSADALAAYDAQGLVWASSRLGDGDLELLGVDGGVVLCRVGGEVGDPALLQVDLTNGRASAVATSRPAL